MPYYDDDGNELDPSTIIKPELCRSCKNDGGWRAGGRVKE